MKMSFIIINSRLVIVSLTLCTRYTFVYQIQSMAIDFVGGTPWNSLLSFARFPFLLALFFQLV